MVEVVKKKYNTGYGLGSLTTEGREMLRRCWEVNPEGCRSADGECGPPPTYPCFMHAGISLNEFWQLCGDFKDRKLAEPLPADFLADVEEL